MSGEVGRMCPFQPGDGRLPANSRCSWGDRHSHHVEVIPALQAAAAHEVTLYLNPVEALAAVDMCHCNACCACAIAKEPVHRPMEGLLAHAAGDLTHILAQVQHLADVKGLAK